ncbi:MAG: hypothetical protein U9N32_09040, partial [Spirochaetota bacterium]|nr:hypothetical protein [Spirochaetota bacterium]
NDNDELIISKALLKVNSDESRWWKIKFESGSDKIIYEFLIDKNYNLLKLRFIDEDSGDIREYIASPEELEAYSTADMRSVEDYEYEDWKTETVNIKTDAGTFTADHLIYPVDETGVNYQWWISNEVPGKMIRYEWKDSEETMTGELIKISNGNKTDLNSF